MNKTTITVPLEYIKVFEIESLLRNRPEIFLPVSFCMHDISVDMTYDYDDHVSLEDMLENDDRLGVRDCLDILEGTLEALRRCVNYFIFPDRLELSLKTVFFNKTERRVKLMFIPGAVVHHENDELAELILEMKDMNVNEDASDYLDRVLEAVRGNTGIRTLENRIKMMKREAFLIGLR